MITIAGYALADWLTVASAAAAAALAVLYARARRDRRALLARNAALRAALGERTGERDAAYDANRATRERHAEHLQHCTRQATQ